ncbi:PREDICTED: mediator of DNA damage checkpoint protein 1 [Drosophila arizonae]|uniref:PAX-interacting protein 1 n=1 Tax=Drosophila arizonae TaxID=7263 RepID=A0ABM1P7Y5_DROAR|nr:PREDICTED: mediator of DNA damage checkpoint protein 1 [Drosophila arizonae]
MAAINIEINNKEAVKLEPDIIYRVGRRPGLEFSIDDDSVELAHATIVWVAGGIVRLAAVNGDVFVNGLKTGLEIKSISEADAINGLVDLAFGNVTGKLRFNDVHRLDTEEANDSSGFGEATRGDKSTNITDGSFNIPESEPQSANNTGITDSFVIPETQAFCLDRPAKDSKSSKISLGDDFIIPETQDILLNASNNPIPMNQELDIINEDDCSELGTQIRICTQDFNEFNEDAIDDFDASLILGNRELEMLPPAKQPKDTTGADPDMSALNWSASNSKCTALNSTKADDLSSRGDICLTPDLSLAEKGSGELQDDADCTPDIFDVLNAIQKGSSPDLNLPATVLCSPSTKVVDKQKEPVVASLQTPDSIPTELLDNCQDFVATQAFPATNVEPKSFVSNTKGNEEDFLETQPFPKGLPRRKSSTSDDTLEDFIATQVFVRPGAPMPKSKELMGTRLSITAQVHSHNEDFIETQVFPTNKIPSDPRLNAADDNLEDYIATQAFIKPPTTFAATPNKAVDAILSITAKIADNTQDMLETQLFISPVSISARAPADKKDADCLQVPNSIKIGDELDKDLSQLIGLSSSDDAEESIVEQGKNTIENAGIKSPQSTEQENQRNLESSRKRSSSRSESPEASPCKKIRTRRISKSSAPSEAEESKLAGPTKEKRTRLKRPSMADEDTPPKKTRVKKDQLTTESASDAKTQKTKASDQTEVRVRGRPRGSKKSGQQSNDAKSEVKTAEENGTTEIEEAVTKSRKSKKANDSSDDKVVNQDVLPVSRQTRRHSQLIDNIVEENGEEITKDKKEEDIPIPKKETRRAAKGAKKDKAGSARAATRKSDSAKPTLKNVKDTKEVNGDASDKGLRSSSRSSLETIEDEPTTSSNARKMNTRRSKQANRNPLIEINDYIKKIKRSGKLRLALSMCNHAELTPVLTALKNAIEVTNDPVECDLLIMDRGERTYKFLVGVAGNKPILSTQWLHAMKKTCSIIVEPDHIFKDEKFEETYKFKPLSVFENPSLLKGIEFMLGGDIQPSPNDMKAIIESAGGTVHAKVPSIASNIKLYAIASKKDKHVWSLLRNYKDVQYITTEGVMQAVVQHNLGLLDEHKLHLVDISK